MASMEELRQGVVESLPEVNKITDEELRGLVIEAWAFALSQSEFTSIDQIRGSGVPDSPALKDGTQADHLRGVARMAHGPCRRLGRGPWGTSVSTGTCCGRVRCAMMWASRLSSV